MLAKRLRELFKAFPVVVVSGARQVGKSTLLAHLFPNVPRVVFDPVLDVENARQDPELFLNNRLPPIILDEIQYAPEVIPSIKRRLEHNRAPGQYLLTGSQQWGVMKLLAESLAGRAVFLDLEGFSLAELGQQEQQSWLMQWLEYAGPVAAAPVVSRLTVPCSPYEQIWRGFLPEAQFLARDLLPTFHASYIRTYIERDVRQLAEVSDLQTFRRFFQLCGALTAQEMNYSQFGRELGITPQTAQRWLGILKATFQWYELPPYFGNAIKRLSEKSKGYLGDVGLVCAAQAITTPDVLGGHPLWGAIFETAVVSDIRKQCQAFSRSPNLYHWRTHGGAEVDLLLEYNGRFFPIEIKGKSRPTKNDARGIAAFRTTYPNLSVGPGLIVALTDTAYPVEANTMTMPWDAGA